MKNKKIIYSLMIIISAALIWFGYNLYDQDKDLQAIKILDESGMNFHKGTFSEALDKAKNNHNIIMINFYSSWCNVCRKMKKDVFSNPKVKAFYNHNFLNMALNIDKEPGLSLAKKFDVDAYPTILFVDEDSKLIHKIVGFKDVDSFIQSGQKILAIKK
ncbi:MAG: thioredoxin fold domain-containing protein [Raineya sp.]|jgi:thiol:disulfide interchange protein|nr:thioredoxin fold domain-containing protein [Raineya sp.]